MISFLQPLPVGNAIRGLLAPAEGATLTRVLRKPTDDIAGATDALAAVVYEGDEPYFIDSLTLANGTPYFYRAFDLVSGSWVASDSATATPSATAEFQTPDPLETIRLRLAAGLKAEVQAGRLVHDAGAIPVFTAPPLFEESKFPIVTVHLRNDAPAYRGLGEDVTGDLYDADSDTWIDSEGWISGVSFEVIGWAMNPDVRNDLRKAIKKVVIGNLPVFAAAAISEVEFSQSDTEDMESYGAAMYQTVGSLTCKAPSVVAAGEPAIDSVTPTLTNA